MVLQNLLACRLLHVAYRHQTPSYHCGYYLFNIHAFFVRTVRIAAPGFPRGLSDSRGHRNALPRRTGAPSTINSKPQSAIRCRTVRHPRTRSWRYGGTNRPTSPSVLGLLAFASRPRPTSRRAVPRARCPVIVVFARFPARRIPHNPSNPRVLCWV